MLPRERVAIALDHREPDRIPWGEHYIDYNVYEDILGHESLVHAKMRETQALWEGRRDEVVAHYKRDVPELHRALEMDIVCAGPVPRAEDPPEPMERIDDETWRDEEGNLYHVSIGTYRLMPYERNPEAYEAPTLESLEREIAELEAEPPEDPMDSKWELVRHVVAEMGDTHYILAFSYDLAYPTFGPTAEDQWISLLTQPKICRKIAELRGKRMVKQVPVFRALGVDGIMPPGDLGSSTSMLASPAIYRDMMLPWQRAHVAEAHRHGLAVHKHCCGHVWPVIDDLADTYDSYEGIQASGGMDICRLKERVGDRLTLWGGIWHEKIISGTVADIADDARYAFSCAAPGGGYFMGSSHSLAVGAKAENVLEMKRARDEWGVYPIDPARFAR
jgi:hypothetical protein